ncbi:MAG: flagellar basal body rod protein FlgB [Alphaproteobacteria bacterium]|nr:flagellar basal body rod protein FlgB [Alphaproteobacteria bacterium]
MTTQDIGLFQALSAKMDYLNQRQTIISRNIANTDTPDYKPQDLKKFDFSKMLERELSGADKNEGVKPVTVATTDDQHMPNANNTLNDRPRDQRETYEVAPAGNAVIMEEQLINAGNNAMDYNLMLNVYQKQVNLFRIAMGSGR